MLRRIGIALLVVLGVIVEAGAFADIREGAEWDLYIMATNPR